MIEAIAIVEAGGLSGPEIPAKWPAWGSLAVPSEVAIDDEERGVVIRPAVLHECRTVDAVVDLVGDRLAA